MRSFSDILLTGMKCCTVNCDCTTSAQGRHKVARIRLLSPCLVLDIWRKKLAELIFRSGTVFCWYQEIVTVNKWSLHGPHIWLCSLQPHSVHRFCSHAGKFLWKSAHQQDECAADVTKQRGRPDQMRADRRMHICIRSCTGTLHSTKKKKKKKKKKDGEIDSASLDVPLLFCKSY